MFSKLLLISLSLYFIQTKIKASNRYEGKTEPTQWRNLRRRPEFYEVSDEQGHTNPSNPRGNVLEFDSGGTSSINAMDEQWPPINSYSRIPGFRGYSINSRDASSSMQLFPTNPQSSRNEQWPPINRYSENPGYKDNSITGGEASSSKQVFSQDPINRYSKHSGYIFNSITAGEASSSEQILSQNPQDEQDTPHTIDFLSNFSKNNNEQDENPNSENSLQQKQGFDPEIHKFIILEGKTVEVRGYCRAHYKIYGIRKKVKSKCAACNKYLCPNCHMIVHDFDTVPTMPSKPIRFQQNKKKKEIFEVEICSHCNETLGNEAETVVEHTRTCKKIPRRMKNGKKVLYACYRCEIQTNDKTAMISHIRSHTGEKPFECYECGTEFTESSSLTRHIEKNRCKNNSTKNEQSSKEQASTSAEQGNS